MAQHLKLVGMLISNGVVQHNQELRSSREIVEFLKANLFPEWDGVSNEQVVIVEAGSRRPVFNAIGGVDLDSELHNYGVDLPGIYRDINRQQSKGLSELSRQADAAESSDEEDSIGLSVSEMVMRKETLRSARLARTVDDVAKLVQDTYFTAWFETADHNRSWGYFEPADYSVQPMTLEDGGWTDDGSRKRIILDGKSGVQFDGAGEDIVQFVILEPPP
jgi:hypothetical protein